jgi:hypothetical protein
MLDEATAIHPTEPIRAAAAEDEANVWQIALLLIAQDGSEAAVVARQQAQQAEMTGDTLEHDIWQWTVVAVGHLLGMLSPTDLLYATALLPPPTAQTAARAA